MAAVLVRSSILRRPLGRSLALALYPRQTSTAAKYVPGGPILPGTVNDPTSFPPPSKLHGSYHWSYERLLSASLIPLTGAAFVTGGTSYPVLDGLLGVGLVVHSHFGFDQIVIDYLHPRKFPVLGQLAKWGLRAATAGVLVGVYQFNTNDIELFVSLLFVLCCLFTIYWIPSLTELIKGLWHA